MSTRKKIGIIGASGYTGADAVRLLARHPGVEISALTANTHAGKAMDEVFPHFFMLDLPKSHKDVYDSVEQGSGVGYLPATMDLYKDIIDLRQAERRGGRS